MVILAVSGGAAVLWWLGLAFVVLVVIPAVLVVAAEVLRALNEIRRYSDDILEHGVGLAGALDPVPELERTRALSAEVSSGFGRVADGLARVLDGGRAR